MRKSTICGLTAGICMAMAMNVSAVNPAYTLNPASGSVVTDLKTITIDFTEVPVYFYENNRMAAAVLENTTTGDIYVCNEPDRDTHAQTEGTAYSMTFIHENAEEAEPIVLAGEYQLSIKGMYQIIDDENVDVDPIIANYTVAYPLNYTLNPAAGVAADLQGIILTFPEAMVGFYENNRMPSATLENLTTGNIYTCQDPDRNTMATVDGVEYKLMFADLDGEVTATITEPGEYLLTIRGMYQGEIENMSDLPAITAKYTVNYPVAYTIDPAFGTVTTDLTTIKVDFSDDASVAFYENNRIPVAVLENLTSGNIYVCQEAMMDTRAMTEGKAYTLTFVNEELDDASPVTEPGYYQLTIRSMYNDNGDLPVIIGNYSISYPVDYELNPVDGANINAISQVTLQFPENRNIEFYENNRIPVAVIANLDNGNEYTCQEATRNTFAQLENGIEYTFTFVDEDGDAVEITEPGKYQLTIRGMFMVEGEDNIDLPVINANYTVAYPVNYTLYPDNGARVADLQTISLEFPDNFVGFYENSQIPVAVLENTTTGTVYNCQEADRDTFAQTEGVAYNLTFIGEDEEEVMPITEPGLYKLTVRAMYQNVDEEMVDLPNIYADYTIPYPVEYYLYPDNGATVEDLMTVTVQFPETFVAFYENNTMPVAVLENNTTGKVYTCQEADRNTFAQLENGVEYNLTFVGEDEEDAMPITEPGQYTLTIRAMYQTIDEEEVSLPSIIASYTIAYPFEYILTPADGAYVEQIETIELEFPNSRNIGFYENNPMPVAVLTELNSGDEYICEEAERNTFAQTEGIAYTLRFMNFETESYDPIVEEGTYKLVVRALAELDEEGNPTADLPIIEATYIIASSGVQAVNALEKADVYNVYNFNGIRLVNNGKAADVQNLPAGMYIINGQKVIIRK